MTTALSQILPILEQLAPPRLAESWDNVGLQIGSRRWPVKKIWTALDPLPAVVESACQNGVDLLVTHHPLFFKPLNHIDAESPTGRIIGMAFSHRLAIYSAHTNLDSVQGGVNDALAARVGLKRVGALSGGGITEMIKLVVFVPQSHVKIVLDTIFSLNAGRIGKYASCSFRTDGVGTFMPDTDATPATGTAGALNEVRESRVEVLVARDDLARVVAAIEKVHPYEAMAYDAYPLNVRDPETGLGRIGQLPAAEPLFALAERVKKALGLATVKVVGDPGMAVERVAVCSGSGGSLMEDTVRAGAQAYVSGDLGYHTARDAQQMGIGLIDAGHFGSEQLIVGVLAEAIGKALGEAGIVADVAAAGMETDPFHYL